MPPNRGKPTMADEPDLTSLPQAVVTRKKRLRISIIWIIPLLAAVVAIGIAIQRIRSEGPTITIVFKAAEGIEAGKTFIRYKDVRIGLVSAVELSEDYTKVLVKAKIAKHAAGLMVADAKFWVVEPRITLSGVSGLSTLLSGNYIGFQAGKSAESQTLYFALDEAPIITDEPGRQFKLKTPTLGSLGVGTPIYYRRLNVGQVTGYALAPDGQSVEATIFVHAPYDKYVTTNTRFWNVSGVNVTLGADGVVVRTESVAALLAGGVAFDVPEFATSGAQPAPANSEFTLYRYRGIAMKEPDPVERRYVLYFNESVRGLSTGAPVTVFGLQVGEVTDVGLTYDPKKQVFRPRVIITFFPERLVAQLPTGERTRVGKTLADDDPRNANPEAAPDRRGAGAARATSHRQPHHRGALRRVRVFPRRAEGQDRLYAGPAGAAGGAREPREPRGEARQHPRQDRPVAARRDRQRRADGARDPQPDAEGRGHDHQPRGRAIGARGREDARGAAPRDRRRRPGRQERGHDALQQGLAGAAGPARHAAGDHPGGAVGARSRRLSRTSPRYADPGQVNGETLMPRIVSGAALCVVVAIAAACASTPPPRFYTLSSTAPSGAATSKLSVAVGPVSIPAIVDLPQIVVSTGPNQVALDEFNRWASPLQNNISRVVAENLVALLGTPRVSQFQQSLNADADYRVAIEVQSFESAPGEAATLNAAWLVRRTRDGKSETGRTTVRESAGDKGFDALAAAHSRALLRMSQEIADAIRALDRAAP